MRDYLEELFINMNIDKLDDNEKESLLIFLQKELFL